MKDLRLDLCGKSHNTRHRSCGKVGSSSHGWHTTSLSTGRHVVVIIIVAVAVAATTSSWGSCQRWGGAGTGVCVGCVTRVVGGVSISRLKVDICGSRELHNRVGWGCANVGSLGQSLAGSRNTGIGSCVDDRGDDGHEGCACADISGGRARRQDNAVDRCRGVIVIVIVVVVVILGVCHGREAKDGKFGDELHPDVWFWCYLDVGIVLSEVADR